MYVDHNPVGEFTQRGQGAFQKTTRYFGLEADIWADVDGQTGPGQTVLTISEGCFDEMPDFEPEPESEPEPEEEMPELEEEDEPEATDQVEEEGTEVLGRVIEKDKREDVTTVAPPAKPVEAEPNFTG